MKKKMVLVLVLLFVSGCGMVPPPPPSVHGEYRPINQTFTQDKPGTEQP